MIRILVNCASISKGGGLQAAVSFLRYILQNSKPDQKWDIVISRPVADQLNSYIEIGRQIHTIGSAPSRSKSSRLRILRLADGLKPHAVFTFFGPAYVRFNVPHVCGVADGWVTHSTRLAFSRLRSLTDKARMFLLCCYKGYWFRQADQWIVEAECARAGLQRRCRIRKEDIHVVSNTCDAQYQMNLPKVTDTPKPRRSRLITLTAYYPHKNLEIIPHVAQKLKIRYPCLDFEFIITIPQDTPEARLIAEKAELLGVKKHVVNIGPVKLVDGPALYRSCSIAFIPTLLETFSASYPEAMAMGLPIVTTNLSFAREICQDAAKYYSPIDPDACADTIVALLKDRDERMRLVELGAKRLLQFPSSEEKNESIRNIVVNFATKNCGYSFHKA